MILTHCRDLKTEELLYTLSKYKIDSCALDLLVQFLEEKERDDWDCDDAEIRKLRDQVESLEDDLAQIEDSVRDDLSENIQTLEEALAESEDAVAGLKLKLFAKEEIIKALINNPQVSPDVDLDIQISNLEDTIYFLKSIKETQNDN